MEQVRQKYVRRELLRRRKRPVHVIRAAKAPLQIKQLCVGNRRVVIQDQPQGKFLRELIIEFRAVQVVVEDAVPRRKRRWHRAITRSQPVVNQRFIQSQPRRGPQRKSEIHAIYISKKRQESRRREEIFSGALYIPCGKR